MRAVLLLLLALASCREATPRADPAPTAPAAAPLTQLGPWLQAEAAADRFSGAVIVARGDQVLHRGAYGLADRGTGAPLTPEHRFRLASVSKQFTAAAILKLQDQGVLSVDDPVCRWIEPCPEAWRPITLHHLLSHQSGVPDLVGRKGWADLRWRDWTLDQLATDSAGQPLEFPPGTDVEYSNAGVNLLGTVIERATGRPFAQYLRTALLDPLGMKNTGWDDGSVPLATGYAATAEGLGPRRRAGAAVVFASGALYSTVDDMLAWSRALHGGRVLSPRSYAQMIAADPERRYGSVVRGTPQTFGYGVFVGQPGLRVNPGFSDRQIFHTGSWSGFRALATYQPDAGVHAIVLSNNYEQAGAVSLATQRAMAEALGHPLPIEVVRRTPTPSAPPQPAAVPTSR